MPRSRDAEANEAAGEAIRGAAGGAARWGIPLLTLSVAVFLIMSGMVIGGAIHGDRSLRAFEAARREAKIRRRLQKDEEVWQKWETEVEKSEREGKNK